VNLIGARDRLENEAAMFWGYFSDLMFDLNGMFSKELVSAVVGAVVGGLIAFGVQIIALREARSVRDRDRLLARQALAHALLFKMIRIYSNTVQINRYVEDRFTIAAERKLRGDPWTFILPFANLPERMHFSPDEMGMLLSLKDSDLFNLVINQDVCHNSLNDIVSKFNECRKELTDQLEHDQVNGDMLSGVATREQYMKVVPRIIEVNDLISGIRAMSKRNADEGRQAILGLQKVFLQKLGLNLQLQFDSNKDTATG
jgi:hypothetical protein